MAAFILTLIGSLLIGGTIWLIAGSRFAFAADEDQNEWYNFAAYYLGSLPVSFVLVFFGLGGL